MPATCKLLDDNINNYANRIYNNDFFSGFVTGVFSTVMFFSIFHKCAPQSFLYGSKIIKL